MTELLSQLDRHVLSLTLNRPEKLNSLTPSLLAQLRAAFEAAGTDPDVRCVVLSGAGRAFCSGQAVGLVPEPGVREILGDYYHPLLRAIVDLDKPVVAAVNGIAAGAGAALALACDLRIMSDAARFAFLFQRIGLAADSGVSYFLPRLVGSGLAAEMLMTGRDVSAAEAVQCGLANRVAASAEFESTVSELAVTLARGPASVGLIKSQLRASVTNDFESQLAIEVSTQLMAAATMDYAEGKAAFAAKRPAAFTGR